MINMNYCVFENTYKALCEALQKQISQEPEEMGEMELGFRKNLYYMCKEFVGECEEIYGE